MMRLGGHMMRLGGTTIHLFSARASPVRASKSIRWRRGNTGGDTMIEVFPSLFVGNEDDYLRSVRGQVGWCVVHACKEPYHRQALGYTGRAASKNDPEYLVARRGNRLILNFGDAPDPAYIPREMVDKALEFMHECIAEGLHVLVHCNQGASRAPTLALLYLAKYTTELPCDVRGAIVEFRRRYPAYNPAAGVLGFTVANWDQYAG
jgi:hypothetical protein